MKKYIAKISILGLIIFIFCISILMIPTQAYFTKVVTSVANVIRAANYDLEITVVPKTKGNTDLTNGNELEAGEYTITLVPNENCAKHGFCVIEINGKTYYTVPIEDEALNLTLKLDTDSEVRFIAHWGEAENYEIVDSEWTLVKEGDTIAEMTSTVVSLAQVEETTSETSTATAETTATETTMETTTATETTATETTMETTTTVEESTVETTTEETTTLPAETTAETTTDVNSES